MIIFIVFQTPSTKFHLDGELSSDKMLDVWAALVGFAVGDESNLENRCKGDVQVPTTETLPGKFFE